MIARRFPALSLILAVVAAGLTASGLAGQDRPLRVFISAEEGIHFALLTPICRGVREVGSPSWGGRLPAYARRIRRVVLFGACVPGVSVSSPVAPRVRLPRVRCRWRMGDEPGVVSMLELCPADFRHGGDSL